LKKALVVAMVMVLGLGALAFAGPLTGTWDTSISLDPSAATMSGFFTDFSSSFTADYVVGGWTFGSATAFTLDGFSSQSFTAAGVLGAFSFDATMAFNPMSVTAKTYSYGTYEGEAKYDVTGCWADAFTVEKTTVPAFTDFTATGSVSIAGVSFEGLFYLDGGTPDVTLSPLLYWAGTGWWSWNQTPSKVVAGTDSGSGLRLSLSGTAGDATITSLTYFNISEADATDDNGCPIIGKDGSYDIATAGCGVGFTEEYITIEGISFACMNLDLAVDLTCSGFGYFKAIVSDITFIPWMSLNAGVKFTTTDKVFTLCGSFLTSEDLCFSIDAALIGFPATAPGAAVVSGLSIYGISMSYDFGGIVVSSDTSFNMIEHAIAGNVNSSAKTTFFVPMTGLYDATICTDLDNSCCTTTGTNEHYPSVAADYTGYYDAMCFVNEYYEIWESFGIEATGDSCCGGSYDITVDTYFGDQYVLDGLAYRYYFGSVDTPGVTAYMVAEMYDVAADGTFTAVTGTTAVLAAAEAEFFTWAAPTTISGGTATCNYTEKLSTGAHYSAGTATTLFNWAKTEISGSFDLASSFSLTGGLSVSAYGWGSLTFGFGFTF